MTGSGTAEDPYIIADVDDLQAIEDHLASYYELGGNIDASATSGWNGGEGFIPISNFTGQLDGKDYTISSLFIARSDHRQGLFGKISSSAVLQNINLTGLDIAVINAVFYHGGLVGNMLGSSTSITGCTTAGSITGDNCQYIGGLVGYMEGGTISNCSSSCTVTLTDTGGDHAGGLIAYMEDGDIDRCFATGDVSVGDDDGGGFVGRALAGTINDCYARGTVAVTNDYGGGFIAINAATITDCYSTGAVSGDAFIGGFCGIDSGTIADCFWDTETSGTEISDGGTGKTTIQMKTKSTFTDAGWDFDTPIWYIGAAINAGYPAFIGMAATVGGLNPALEELLIGV